MCVLTGTPGRRLYVTDSWILKTTTYCVYVAHQNDISLVLDHAEEHPLSYESATTAQYLNISIQRVEPYLSDFKIRQVITFKHQYKRANIVNTLHRLHCFFYICV